MPRTRTNATCASSAHFLVTGRLVHAATGQWPSGYYTSGQASGTGMVTNGLLVRILTSLRLAIGPAVLQPVS